MFWSGADFDEPALDVVVGRTHIRHIRTPPHPVAHISHPVSAQATTPSRIRSEENRGTIYRSRIKQGEHRLMRLKADEMILFRNTMRITEGHLEAFKHAIREAVNFVEQNGPQLMVQTFIDEQRMLAFSYQLYRDSESILRHWQLADPYISKVMEHCTVEDFQVHGEPSEAVLQGLQAMIDDGRAIVTQRLAGFVRLAPGARD